MPCLCTVSVLHGGHAMNPPLQPKHLKVLLLIEHIHRNVRKRTCPSLCAYIHAASCMPKTYSYISDHVSFLLHACRNQHCIITCLVSSCTCNNHSHGAVQSTGVDMHMQLHIHLYFALHHVIDHPCRSLAELQKQCAIHAVSLYLLYIGNHPLHAQSCPHLMQRG